MKKSILFATVLMLFGFASTLFAEISVVSVKGTVAYSRGDAWLPITAGMKLSEGMKISTGVKSSAVLKLANSTVTVKPLSMMKIYEDRLSSEQANTSLGLRRGAVKAEVNRMKTVKTVFKIATPVATSSVRGTVQEVVSGFYGTCYNVTEGSIGMTGWDGQSKVVSNNLSYSQSTDSCKPDSLMGTPVVSMIDSVCGDEKESMEQNSVDVFDVPGGVIDSFHSAVQSGVQSLILNIQFGGR